MMMFTNFQISQYMKIRLENKLPEMPAFDRYVSAIDSPF
jgi:hypothetical protein